MLNYEQTIIAQYANSPTILQLIQNMNFYLDPTTNIDNFYDLMWNVATAQGYGLDVWGRIVGVGRVLQVSGGSNFGFSGPSGTSGDPFNISPFYSGAGLTSNYALSDDAFRTLIYAKALSNICDGSIPAINQLLLNLFPGQGNCYVADGENMTLTFTFNFALTPVEAAIVGQSGILPKACGVASSVSHL
jgi:hypothetical protein